ncbi:hypothetical protein [Flagellimonas sp.]|uniref:hypothetical protein n=1 Tax=Flagellimonas sp. TaxID=2058762 RepID=UPI003F49EA0E
MDWYIPITIVPAVGLIILSTSNLLIALSTEIKELIKGNNTTERLIQTKLKQLKRLSWAMIFLYVSVASFVISGLIGGIYQSGHKMVSDVSIYIVVLGIFMALAALFILIAYALSALKIRQNQFLDRY